MERRSKLLRLYQYFCSAEGSQNIASEYAIQKLQDLVTKLEVKNVLEVGLGIGSIAGTLLKLNKKLSYSGTETNDLCLKALPKNLSKNYERLVIYPDLLTVPDNILFKLIIVDE